MGILTTDTDTVLDTLDTILDTLDTIDSDTMVVSDTTARGLLMLRPIPSLLRIRTGTPRICWTPRIRTGTPPRLCWTSRIRIRTRIPRRILLRQVDYIKIFQ